MKEKKLDILYHSLPSSPSLVTRLWSHQGRWSAVWKKAFKARHPYKLASCEWHHGQIFGQWKRYRLSGRYYSPQEHLGLPRASKDPGKFHKPAFLGLIQVTPYPAHICCQCLRPTEMSRAEQSTLTAHILGGRSNWAFSLRIIRWIFFA